MDWWKSAFNAWYPVVYAKRDDASASIEVDSALPLIGLRSRQRILDLACGGGRHARALSRFGCAVVGCDQSRDLLRSAIAKAGGPFYVAADQRALPFADASFDAVTCFFTSFGYGPDDAHDRRILDETARVVRRSGGFLLDLPNKGRVIEGLVAESEERRDGIVIRSRRKWTGSRVEKDVVVSSSAGEPLAAWRESVHLYEEKEVIDMLDRAGFEIVDSRNSLGTSDDRLVLTSRRR